MPEPSEDFIRRLRKSIDSSNRRMKVYNKLRQEALRQFVGRHYSDEGAEDRIAFPGIYTTALAYMAHLVASNPAAWVRSRGNVQLSSMAHLYELGLNHLYEEIDLEGTLAQGVFDALFGVAIFKTGIAPHATVEIEGFLHDVGQPFCECVSQNDWGMDPSARIVPRAKWMGNRYRLPLDYIKDSGLFENATEIQAYHKPTAGEEERDEDLAGETNLYGSELVEEGELWDIWLPMDNLLITLAAESNQGDKPLRVVEWQGPETGPYDILGFTSVSECVYPLPPVAIWRDMDSFINTIGRKLFEAAERYKTITTYERGAEQDAQRIIDAPDSATVLVKDNRKIQERTFGGVHPHNMGLLIYAINLYSKIAGNVELLAGTGGQAETLGQTEILSGNQGKRIRMMERRLHRCAESITKKLAWYLAYDPLIQLPLVKRVEGTDLELPVMFSPESREGDWLDYNFSIRAYSMQQATPEQKAMRMMQWWSDIVMPLLEGAMQQGTVPNFEGLIKLTAKYLGIEELPELILSQGGMPSSVHQRPTLGRAPRKRESLNVHVHGGGERQFEAGLLTQLMAQPAPARQRQPVARTATP